MILLTGATGFVGGAILKRLSSYPIRVLGRGKLNFNEVPHYFGDINSTGDYNHALVGVDVVIHAAARSHIMDDSAVDPLNNYLEINLYGTINLAKQAAAQGVKRFIYISSIKVNGEFTQSHTSFKYDDVCMPVHPYSISKYRAEVALKQLAQETGMELVVIRPPLVYGPGVKANFERLLRLAKLNLPIPLGAIHNYRSLVALDNLVDLIITCINHPKAANQTFLVSDDQDISTTELLKKMASAFGGKSRLIPIPMSWLFFVARLVGKEAVAERLFGSLQVDMSHTKEVLGWKPPVTMEQQLAKIAASLSQLTPDH